MPSCHIINESMIQDSFRVKAVAGMFDVPDRKVISQEWNVDIPVEGKDWQIGLIVGPSGSGKTTIGRRVFQDAYFHEGYDWDKTASIVDGFPAKLETRQIVHALSSVGFSSPPHWLKRYDHLSNGQKFRAELARLILEDKPLVVIDEYTSVIDRSTAQIASAAVSKAIRNTGVKFVALSCHYDIVDWLQPDWIYDTVNQSFTWRLVRRRPEIKMEVWEADRRAWRIFAEHHYLSKTINRAAECYIATIDGNPVGFTSHVHFPHAVSKYIKREHRTVILPDYQGVGIGTRLSDWLAARTKAQGYRYISTSGHPAMIRHRAKSKNWKQIHFGRTNEGSCTTGIRIGAKDTSSRRLTATYEYVGGKET